MPKIKLLTSNLTGWQTLIKDAQLQCNNKLTSDLEAYLIFTLAEYLYDTSLLNQKIGEQFLQSSFHSKTIQKQTLKSLGDRCLLLTGLFPGQISRRFVSVTYFSAIGQASYDYLAALENTHLEKLYYQLSKDFYFLLEILFAIRPLNAEHPLQSHPKLAYNIWKHTKSNYIKQFFILH